MFTHGGYIFEKYKTHRRQSMNYSTQNCIALDGTPCNMFIHTVAKDLDLFDTKSKKVALDDKHVSILGLLYNSDEARLGTDFNLPLICFLKILDQDVLIAFHYAIIDSTQEYERDPFDGPRNIYYEYLVLYSYIINGEPRKILQEDFTELYNVLVKHDLLDRVETDLERIILLNA